MSLRYWPGATWPVLRCPSPTLLVWKRVPGQSSWTPKAVSAPSRHFATPVLNRSPCSLLVKPQSERRRSHGFGYSAVVWRDEFPTNCFLPRPVLLNVGPAVLEHVGTLFPKVNSKHPNAQTWIWQMIKGQKGCTVSPPSLKRPLIFYLDAYCRKTYILRSCSVTPRCFTAFCICYIFLTGKYALNNFEVGFIFPLMLRMGKLGVTERETDPKFVTPDLVSFLSVERWTETFSGCRWKEWGRAHWEASSQWQSLAGRAPEWPSNSLVTLFLFSSLCQKPLSSGFFLCVAFLSRPPVYLKLRAGNRSVMGKSASPGTLKIFFS